MAHDADVVKLEVVVYPDGGTQISMPPVEEMRRAPLLESAAAALRVAADAALRDLEPVTCAQCGEAVVAVTAPVSGATELHPCGHPGA